MRKNTGTRPATVKPGKPAKAPKPKAPKMHKTDADAISFMREHYDVLRLLAGR